MASFVRGLACSKCGRTHPSTSSLRTCNKCGEILEIEYDLEILKGKLDKKALKKRVSGVWKYAELLPIMDQKHIISLGEGNTYLHPANLLSSEIGVRNLLLKNETTNPTGSFLDRGSSVEVSVSLENNRTKICCGSTGNLAASVVAYAAKAAIDAKVFMAQRGRVDIGKFYQILAYGADVEIVRTREEAISLAMQREPTYHPITSNNPPFLEGTKTMIFDICEQMEWKLPDWILTPMGSGGNLSMIWKGLIEFQELGLIEGNLPRLIGTQVKGISPIVDAYRRGDTEVKPSTGKPKLAMDIGVANPVCGSKALRALRESKGRGITVMDSEILDSVRRLAKLEGVFAEPASATTIAALKKLVDQGIIDPTDTVICIITGSGLKSPEIAESFVKGRKDLVHLLSRLEGRKYTTKLGRTKVCILRILTKNENYGYEIWKQLDEKYGIQVRIPSVYQHLSELARGGLIVETKEMRSHEKRVRKYYDLTDRGRWTLSHLEEISK
ncbi:MAG: hypothetical protein BAJATHORv1_90063 [Candidatus Thorarchaeota archaeon]|nr:MAG: hypothetical protein BAJATHORv1_90063 [Candidatus Thorarchaeota archaeon]